MPKPTTNKKNAADPDRRTTLPGNGLSHGLLQYLADSDHRVSAAELERHLVQISGESRAACRRRIRSLVSAGELAYTYELGNSYVEPSFQRPVALSNRLICIPPQIEITPPEGMIALRLDPGAAFGCGRHPSTRVALRAVETAFQSNPYFDMALDVGTGSGILIIAAVRLGAQRGLGIDIDGCARMAAAENVRINHLEDRIRIGDTAVDALARAGVRYDLVIANLRTPTLIHLGTHLSALVRPEGYLVVSGIQNDECRVLEQTYGKKGLYKRWQTEEKGWCGLVFRLRA
jgi:ribosomal protein L11 methyltransferase